MTEQKTQPTILFEDDHLLVLNKPAGWVVNRSDSAPEHTVQDWLEEYFAHDAAWQESFASQATFAERAGMAHRLDRDTSGVLLVGKSPEIMDVLLEQFKQRQVSKTYQALAHGKLPASVGVVDAPILRDPETRTRFIVSEGGRESRTLFHVAQEYKGFVLPRLQAVWKEEISLKELEKKIMQYQGFSLVTLQPKTGRTHQIRVHLRFLGNPIVGDYRYNTPKRSFFDAQWCPRQFLHALSLRFVHPVTGEAQTVTAPLPSDLAQVLTLLEARV